MDEKEQKEPIEQVVEKFRQRAEMFDLRMAVIMLCLSFVGILSIPLFFVGRRMEKEGLPRWVAGNWLWALTLTLSFGWLILLPFMLGGSPGSSWLSRYIAKVMPSFLQGALGRLVAWMIDMWFVLVIVVPIGLAGLPSGILFEKAKKVRYAAVVPILASGFLFTAPVFLMLLSALL